MEKKFMSRLLSLLFSGVLLAGCGNQVADTPNETEEVETENVEVVTEEKTVTVEVYAEEELLEGSDKELSVEEDADLMQIMEENYDIEEQDGFMETIEGYEQDSDDGLFWMYYVNNEEAPVGAAEYVPELDDTIEWKLESFE